MEDDAKRDAAAAGLFEQWLREARESPPSLDDLSEMMANIRVYAAFDRDVCSKWEPPDELLAVQGCLLAVLRFLEKQPALMERGDLAPLMRLNAALSDLGVGKVANFLKPARKKTGRPSVGSRREIGAP